MDELLKCDRKTTEQYFPVVLFVLPYSVSLSHVFLSEDTTTKCEQASKGKTTKLPNLMTRLKETRHERPA